MTTATQVKERPILFSAPMVKAILSGVKTMTRRIIKPQPPAWVDEVGVDAFCGERQFAGRGTHPTDGRAEKFIDAKFWHGDQLWAREAWSHVNDFAAPGSIVYRADAVRDDSDERNGWWIGERFYERDFKWKPSIHMPRWASRITLEATSVKVERVQDITEADALAEGAMAWWESLPREKRCVIYNGKRGPIAAFHMLWDSINGIESWVVNPWVFAIAFRRVSPSAAPARAGEGE